MGGAGHFEQRREHCTIDRRSMKWWHRVFYSLICLAIVNAHIMWSHNKSETDQLTFREKMTAFSGIALCLGVDQRFRGA
jgi:hypothetical protein